MSRKHRSKKRKDPGNAADFKVNPFAGLHLDVPDLPVDDEPEAESSSSSMVSPDAESSTLSPEDRELLKAFDGGDTIEYHGTRPSVHLEIQQRARGKKVTCVSGLDDMDALEQMEMAQELKKRLGIGARFNEGLLELQGDQRQRAVDWFQAQGYDVTFR